MIKLQRISAFMKQATFSHLLIVKLISPDTFQTSERSLIPYLERKPDTGILTNVSWSSSALS
jgi:hypothetical protein